MNLRPLTEDDHEFQQAMLMEAAFWRPDAERPPVEDVIARPEFARLVGRWGRDGDAGFVAVTEDGDPVGAIWYRLFTDDDHSWGYVSSEIPEFAIGVVAQHRGQEIGATLIQRLLDHARDTGIAQVSLSVETENPARNLYARLGFRRIGEVDNAWTMVCDTKRS